MELLKRIKAKLLRQKPMTDDDTLRVYMEAARHSKQGDQFARDFVRLVESHHGIVAHYTVEPNQYEI